MTPLSELEARTPPRPAELVGRLAGKLVPTWGFIAYGALYFLVVAPFAFLLIGGVAAWALASAFGFSAKNPMPAAVEALIMLLGLSGVVVSFWPFRLWAKSKRGPARRLFEIGEFVDGVVESTTTVRVRRAPVTIERVAFPRNGMTTHASVSYGGRALHAIGHRRRLLVADGVPLVSAFGPTGAVIAGRIK